jgi:Skp family chaperone for outer membrane proteins
MIGLTVAAGVAACSGEEKEKKEVKEPEVPTVDPKGLKIAFYNSDSLNAGYEYLKEQDSVLKKRQVKFENEVSSRQRKLQGIYQTLVEGEQKMLYSAAELQQKQAEFQRMTQSLENYQQTEGGKLQNEAMEMQTVLQNRITEFAKKYCEKYKLDMLIMYGQGGQFTYYNPKMDVTDSFIDFVNAEQSNMSKPLDDK